ncbi:PEP-CTERM sorting domain-containing protein [Aeoliella sp. ICT_H6.2]|uniref:PEP-CTERM sorting domain-containing protein n=1 Tax=Aeoliella straminimaris TaxID=2954799 RepID=A0A9X2JHN6_9BACT|nr:PEP-CTERM sorting domain-containing protein [Aeoliella straminimaris]MCO6045642.1 PEP-CTERM sorting domain-containing protein [Aeoliella straminimaris]
MNHSVRRPSYSGPIAIGAAILCIAGLPLAAAGEVIDVYGRLPNYFEASDDTVVNMYDGSDAYWFDFNESSHLNLYGGWARGENSLTDYSSALILGGGAEKLRALDDSTVLMHGGFLGSLQLYANASATMTGGGIGDRRGGAYEGVLRMSGQSRMTVSGGSLGRVYASENAALKLVGGEFRLNGQPVAGLDVPGATQRLHTDGEDFSLSGVLEDGSAFLLHSTDWDYIGDGVVTLEAAEIPPVNAAEIHLPGSDPPDSLREGQSLTIGSGGELGDNFTALWGSKLRLLDGGLLGSHSEFIGSEVEVTGGALGFNLQAFDGTTVSISGGTISGDLLASDDVKVAVSGGVIYHSIQVLEGSTLTFTGGDLRSYARVYHGSELQLQGGSIGSNTRIAYDSLAKLTGGSIGDHASVYDSSQIIMSGGTIGDRLYVGNGGTLEMHGGSIGDFASAGSGSVVNVHGGTIGDSFTIGTPPSQRIVAGGPSVQELGIAGTTATPIALVNIFDGQIGDSLSLRRDGVANLYGGDIGGGVEVHRSGVLNVYGGTFAGELLAFSGGTVNLVGTEFILDGMAIDGLTTGDRFQLTARDANLDVRLANGDWLSLQLNSVQADGADFFSPDASVYLMLPVPEPSSLLLLTLALLTLGASCGHSRHRTRLEPLYLTATLTSRWRRIQNR